MSGKMKKRVSVLFVYLGMLAASLVAGTAMDAQTAARILGTVTAISGDALTVKNSQGQAQQVQVPSTADLKRIEPGQTDLSKAVPLQYSDIAVGDRVLISLDPNAAAGALQALRIIAIKQADVAKKQQAEAAEWQRNGFGGLVKSADAAGGDIVIASGAGPAVKILTIHTTKATVLKRYAPASTNYASAQVAPFSEIHPGDQLTARGQKSADGTQMTAAEVVTGSFRNISGTVSSLDPANSTLVVKDLASKKQVTIHVPADAQMRKLPDRIAQMLAARLKGASDGGNGARSASGDAGAGAGSRRGGGMDPQQILSRAPAIHFADLQKGDAVMLVSTAGATDVTAITLVAGVEPILEAPAGQDLLSNWSMSSGPEGGDQ